MFTATLILMPVVVLLLVPTHHPGWGLLVLAVHTLLLWLGGNGMLAAQALKRLEAPYVHLLAPRWGERNAVVLLGYGLVRPHGTDDLQPNVLAHSRILEALRLYRHCVEAGKPCKVIVTGGDTTGSGVSEAAVCGRLARGLGVPEGDLILETASLNTYKNAEMTSGILKAHGFDRIILVTSAFHMRRSLLYFADFNVACEASMADCIQVLRAPVPIGVNLAIVDLVANEVLGILRHRLYSALGWNAKPAQPQA